MSESLSREDAAEMLRILLNVNHELAMSTRYPMDADIQARHRDAVDQGWRMWNKLSQPQNLGSPPE